MENNEKKQIKDIAINLLPIFFRKKQKIGIVSMCAYRLQNKYSKDNMDKYIVINKKEHKVKMLFKRGIKVLKFKGYSYFLNIYKVTFDMEFLKTCPIQNLIKFTFKGGKEEVTLPVVYNIVHFTKYKGYTSKIYNFENEDLACYFRQGRNNSMSITVRKKNITDKFSKKTSIFFAWIISKFCVNNRKVLLYEKECGKYEEGSSVLYEKLIDMGYNNVYYVIDKNSSHVQFIKPKYMKNIIWAHTFKHYLEFFKCKKFIGTESLVHLIELRVANKHITTKIQSKKYKYVFLQHGVMYMVSLDSNNRGFFRKGNEMPKDAKIVVSSKLEAEHFVELGGFEMDDLYITGLPFYDRTTKNDNADKITIMPTWRPWDYTTLISNPQESSYYNFVSGIYNSIPSKLKDKVVLLPHPLVLDMFRKTELGERIPEIISYDLILQDTALLITDYSSISYSAFYRGSNVIFVWNEKDECMSYYGGHLMLNEENVFGDIVYKYDGLETIINENYLKEQKQKYIENYNKIVEFRDNKNTERLIEKLIKDKII